MGMTALIKLHGNDIQAAMPNTALRHQGIGKCLDCHRGAFQNHAFQAILVIQMGVHGRYRQIVIPVL